MEIIKVDSIYKKFGKLIAVNNISFNINEGEIIGYLGPNGSGKTTTIKTILSLYKCDSGTVHILGYDLNNNYQHSTNQITAIFDENGLYLNLSAEENLKFFGMLKGYSKNELKKNINELLIEFDLYKKRNEIIKKFSKGMKRKLAIARALILKPKILVLDEPFDGIDIESKEKIINLLKKYVAENKMTIFFTSHVISDIDKIANRLIIINKGEIIFDGLNKEFETKSEYESIHISLIKKYKIEEIENIFKNKYGIKKILIKDSKLILNKEISNDNIVDILINNNIAFSEIIKEKETLGDFYLRMVKNE